jgi:pilus assembly protein FimV
MQCSKYTYRVTQIAFNACASVMLTVLAGNAGAAELGDVTLHSFAGQPLVADIALMALAPGELAGVQVRLASPDVYRGANVRIHPALASLRMTVMQDAQRPFIHVTTRQAIDADYLHLFLELNFGERHSVRAVTVWLSARPPAAPAAAPTAPAAPAAPVVPAAPVTGPPAQSPGLGALRMTRAEAAPAFKPELATDSGPKPAPKPEPKPKPARKPVQKPVPRSAPDAGANRARLDQEIRDKATLDIENEALRSKIAILEGKVAVLLQERVARLVLVTPQAVAAPVAAPVKTRSTFWIVGAVALALLVLSGGLGFVYRKKIIESRPWVALRNRLQRKAVTPAVSDEPHQAGPD